jgi:hypothetical protein
MSRNIIFVLMYNRHKLLDPDSNDRVTSIQNKDLLIHTSSDHAGPELAVLHSAGGFLLLPTFPAHDACMHYDMTADGKKFLFILIESFITCAALGGSLVYAYCCIPLLA